VGKRPPPQKPITLRDILGTAAVQQESLLFVLVSALDVFMTYILLSHGNGEMFVESNPVARFFIAGWGPKGMIYFKFVMVAFVCVLAQIIARRKPRVARWLLLGATGVVSLVVVYSLRLLLLHGNMAEIGGSL
jgi:hypothetical protein